MRITCIITGREGVLCPYETAGKPPLRFSVQIHLTYLFCCYFVCQSISQAIKGRKEFLDFFSNSSLLIDVVILVLLLFR